MLTLPSVVRTLQQAHALKTDNPMASTLLREKALISGLRAVAGQFGKTLEEPIRPDSQGVFVFNIQGGSYGEGLAAILKKIEIHQGRNTQPIHTQKWCRIHHSQAEKLILLAMDANHPVMCHR
ncbi:hypothetical protein D3C79_36690 [compost metagenome]